MDESRDPGARSPEASPVAGPAPGVARGDRVHAFAGDGVRVTWSRMRCTHAAECVMRLPTVFKPGRRSWVDAKQASAEAVARAVPRCPTGALHFERTDGGEPEPVPPVNTVLVSRNGPNLLRGDIEVRDESGAMLLRDTRVALCRCGHSTHRPLCDNAHQTVRFRDDGGVRDGERIEDPGADGSRLVVRPEADGPLRLVGPFALASADGETMLAGTSAALCRCGQSAARPFCDGSHTRTGFRSG